MKATEFLKEHRVYEDEIIYNSVGEIVGTESQLMKEYAALRQPPVRKSVCQHIWKALFVNRPKVCIKCGIYENEQQTVF